MGIKDVFEFSWDLPYRLLCSLAAVISVAAIVLSQTPAQVWSRGLEYLGINWSRHVEVTALWITDREAVFGGLVVLVEILAVVFAGLWAAKFTQPLTNKCASTAWLCFMIVLQLKEVGHPVVWSVALFLAVAVALWVRYDADYASLFFVDFCFSAVYIIAPLAWALLNPGKNEKAS